MKYFARLAFLGAFCGLVACQQPSNNTPQKVETPVQTASYTQVGPIKPDANTAVSVTEALGKAKELGDKTITMKGEVTAVCQKKGCWMSLKNDTGEALRIRFKDYGFFVPKDISGRNVVLSGKFATDTLTVDMQKHLAEEEGKPKADVGAIKETKYTYSVVADGVLIENKNSK
jgi:hypothetical protein